MYNRIKDVKTLDIKNFILSYYSNSNENFHIHKVGSSVEARKPHTHDYFQVYYVSRGTLVHFLGDSSSRLSHGDMFIVPPGVTHYIIPDRDAVFYSLSFMNDFIDNDASQQNKLASNFLKNMQTENIHSIRPRLSIVSDEIIHVENIMEHILEEFTRKPLGYNETIYSYTILLLTYIARNYFENEKTDIANHFDDKKQFVLHCVEYIKNNFTDNISLEEISKRSAMSKSSFCTIFKKITGYSFNSYLNLCRVKKAAELIKKDYKITGIYGLCGYNDFSSFYRNFKKIMGVSPYEYKKDEKK